MFWSIETAYNGTLYRSRTEARWAVMLEYAGIPFQYEPEGYAFEEKNERYVPDFWIPAWDCFLEVKRDSFGMAPGEWPRERCVCEMLADAMKKDVLLAPGSPAVLGKLYRFRPYKFGFEEENLSDLVRLNAVLAGKSHRFDWRKSRPRRDRGDEEGSIGQIASNLLNTMLVRKP